MNYVCEYEKVGRKLCSPTNFRNKEYIYKTKNVNRKFALVIQGNCMRNGRKIVQKINWKKLVRFGWFDDAKQLTGFFSFHFFCLLIKVHQFGFPHLSYIVPQHFDIPC